MPQLRGGRREDDPLVAVRRGTNGEHDVDAVGRHSFVGGTSALAQRGERIPRLRGQFESCGEKHAVHLEADGAGKLEFDGRTGFEAAREDASAASQNGAGEKADGAGRVGFAAGGKGQSTGCRVGRYVGHTGLIGKHIGRH